MGDAAGEIKEWITHFRLNAELEKILGDLGVELVEDLDTIFQGDEGLLLTIRAQLAAPDVDAFIRTYHQYKELVDNNSTTEALSTGGYTFDNGSCSMISGTSSSGSKRKSPEERLKEQKEAKITRRIEVLERKLKAAATLDLLIMLDCTGSMAGFINEAKTKIRSFVTSIGQIYPDIQLRIAFVGYRDHCDHQNRHAILQFTPDVRAFENILALQQAMGGGDEPEDIAGALQVASSMKWESELRVVFHIGDSPCHGTEYHDCCGDSLPLGDPYGLQPVTFLQSLSKQKVRYMFGVLTPRTDKMLKRFRELLGFDYIRAEPMRDVTMIAVITSSVSSIISESLSQSSSMGTGSDVGALKKCEIDESPVGDWDKVITEKVVVFSLRQPGSLEVLCSEEGGGIVEDFPDEACSFVKCALHPFARGGNKLAYRARNVERAGIATRRPLTSSDTVLKESARSGKAHQAKEKFEEYVAAQRAALYLSTEFCKVRPKKCASIGFAPIRLLQFLARPTKPFFIEEAFIAGTWERFNNNTGWCAPFPTDLGTNHEAVQAFSHWTHHVSGGRLMIADCQGCFNAARNTFELTDPAVHSVSLLAYGGTNMGMKGFERFFKTHRCNDVCRALKLAPHV